MSCALLPMNTAQLFSSDVAFTPTVKALQTRKGSRTAYERMEEKGGWRTQITPDLKAFIEAQVSVFLATVDANCPQHIPQRFEAADVEAAFTQRDKRIAELETEVARLRANQPL